MEFTSFCIICTFACCVPILAVLGCMTHYHVLNSSNTLIEQLPLYNTDNLSTIYMFVVQWCKCRLYTAPRYSIIYYHNLDIYLHTKNSELKFQISHITSGGLCPSNFLCKYTHYPGVLSFPITYRKALNTKKSMLG